MENNNNAIHRNVLSLTQSITVAAAIEHMLPIAASGFSIIPQNCLNRDMLSVGSHIFLVHIEDNFNRFTSLASGTIDSDEFTITKSITNSISAIDPYSTSGHTGNMHIIIINIVIIK